MIDDDRDEGPLSVDLDKLNDDETPVAPCPECGEDVYDDAQRCPACGEYVTHRPSVWTGRPWWWILLAAAGVSSLLIYLVSC